MEFDADTIDAVISNSLVHHIPEPAAVFGEVARVAKPGAALFFRDLRRPRDEAELSALLAEHAADCNDYQREMFSDSLRAALTLAEVEALAADAGLDGVRIYESSDRHWTLARAQERHSV